MIKIDRYYLNEQRDPAREELLRLASSNSASERWEAAKDPRLPTETMQKLARDPEAQVRFELALNPGTPPEILLFLAKDPTPLVAAQVERNPNWPEDLTDWALGDDWIDK